MTYDRHTVCVALKEHVKAKYGMQKTAAYTLGLNPAILSRVLSGKQPPHRLLLIDAGLVSKTVYEPRGQ